VGEYQGEPNLCIVMDYCEGGDLRSLIKERIKNKKPFKEKSIKIWLMQLTLALHQMHTQKVLHRDLKPANIFLCKRNHVLVGDFGLSKMLDFTMQIANTYCGTPAYMAPELCCDSLYQKPADIWALGCIIYELATFSLPFQALTLPELYKKIRYEPTPKFPDNYSHELGKLCTAMLVKNPKNRITTTEILKSSYLQEDEYVSRKISSEIKIYTIPEFQKR